MRHTIKDSLTGWGAQRAQGRGDTGGHPRGMNCQLRVENPALLALSYDSKRDFALAYIFTRKCPLPLGGVFLTRMTAASLARCATEQTHVAKKSPFAQAGPTRFVTGPGGLFGPGAAAQREAAAASGGSGPWSSGGALTCGG
jgi:hypothetical protein